MNLSYPVRLSPAEEGGFVVSFPDVPEALTQGEDEAEAMLRAADALETALEMYIDAAKALPVPSKVKRGQRLVRLSAQACIKLSIYQAMREDGVRKGELAKRLGWHMPQVDRLLDLHHASRLDQAETALRALGRELEVTVASPVKRAKSA
jgi:antitoxin HicB